jgi:hypothetical protein
VWIAPRFSSFEAPSASHPCNFKLKCNNLIFNEIMILNASYVCLHAFSLCRESPDLDPGRWTPHFCNSGSINESCSLHSSQDNLFRG